jgi:DNA-binding transcriptional ArsR family regulator
MKSIYDGTALIIMHPVRFSILKFINEAKKPQYVEQIASAINQHPRLISHHLNVLQDLGLVECTYEIATAKGSTKHGVAVRLCRATSKLKEVFQEIAKDAETMATGREN